MKKAISLILCLFIIIASFSSCDTLRGERGFKGEDGDAGPQGEQGIQGEQGLKGDKGDKGESGEQGPKGDKGEQGENGDSYILSENDKMDIAKFLSENSMNKINITSGSGYYDTEGNWIESDEFISKYTNLISVQEGDKFTYRGLGVWNVASVIWYNVECEIISYEQYGEWDKTLAEVIVTAPKGTEYVRFCSFSGINSELILEVSYYSDNCLVSKLSGKKIVYDGDSICYGGSVGGYAQIIADNTGSEFENQAQGGARLITAGENGNYHSVVDNLKNLSTDGDIYCFQGGINDYWGDSELGTFDYINFDGELDTTTVCGALETIFRYALNNFVGKPICFVITHKIQYTAYSENKNGDTFEDYHDAMVGICEKYSIPYYDAFCESGLNGWNTYQSNVFLTGNSLGTPDGIHPNAEGYKRYYVPQLIALFEKIMLIDDSKQN